MADVSHIVNKPYPGILEYKQDALPDGSFQYGYKTENGISAQAEGLPDGETHGSYQYPGEDGKPIEVIWSAGVGGFVAQGSAIHPTPESVIRTLAYNAAHPYKEPTTL